MAEGSLEFICGGLGSGKTSCGFERALIQLLRGCSCDTNVEFYPDVIAKWMRDDHGLKFEPERLQRIEDGPDMWKQFRKGTKTRPATALVDEAHVEHNARDFQKTTFEEGLFNTMARKLDINLIYITQDFNNVDKQFRRLAQMIWYCRNAKQQPLMGFMKCPFNLFFRVPYVCAPGVPPRLGSPEIVLRPLSWGMFNSKALVGRAEKTFSIMASAKDSPLERIPKPPKPFPWHTAAAAAAGAMIALT